MGWPSIAWGLRNISSRELSEWMAFYGLDPFGDKRADLRMATLAALTANINRDPKKHPEPFSTTDFMPFDGPVGDEHDEELARKRHSEALLAKAVAMNKALGGKDLRAN